MENDGTYGARDTRSGRVPHPAGSPPAAPPPSGPVPPRPRNAPSAVPAPPVDVWLSVPRPAEEPGVWRYGHRPPPPEKTEEAEGRQLLTGALISVLAGILIWSLWRNGYLPYRLLPLRAFTPGDWWYAGTNSPATMEGRRAYDVYQGIVFGLLLYGCGRLGNWAEVFRRYVAERGQPFRAVTVLGLAGFAQLLVWKDAIPVAKPVLALVVSFAGGRFLQSQAASNWIYAAITLAVLAPFVVLGGWRDLLTGRRESAPAADGTPDGPGAADPERSPARWPELRAAGQTEAAETLTAEVRAGRMNDVDCARLRQAWTVARQRPDTLAPFTHSVLTKGGAAFLHPSGRRDLPSRAAVHDLLTGQVRIGRCSADPHNPYARRGSGVALETALLGTSLLAVGPHGSGKSARLVLPVVECLALQALAGRAAVLAVGGGGTDLGPDDLYDVVVTIGGHGATHGLDLYGGTTDPDEAAAVLAEGLVGDVETVDVRRAVTVLAQLLGPYRAVYGVFPAVPELRALLDGHPASLDALREATEAGGHRAMLRELDARSRQSGGAGDPGPVLADRLALLDRPALADSFATGPDAAPFSLRSMERLPLRVRIDLPERAHAEASRLLARLVLAQFTAVAAARQDRTLFLGLVLDDATRAVTDETVRGIRRLRSVNAGVLLTLRTVDDVPERLHTALLGAVGCGMAFAGVTTWDGKRFSEAWGKEWMETREVAQHAVFADQSVTRALHALRKLVTGKAVTRDAVTVRRVERERWSASELAYAVPAGHAVVSLTNVVGERTPPLLVELGG
ncbi:ATP/GTP-binding protein [Streptomyces sp. NBC_00102]|uniref:ATP/GTP-binding protein n=1 Tax=Streptomyces sp. NBC_00102 TaxID=2975652 RepID=UPI002259D3AE|nr:ATP/GTP-binding protein [Streptomyces sp. NBC_00102]MCX5400101.1 ATP/GTP-binding protein [Streptomyces sp. NBC_00102]